MWTGPEAQAGTARDTSVVLRELFEGARENVIVAGYWFVNAEHLLRPLHHVMCTYGVSATFFVHIDQPKFRVPAEEHVSEKLARFFRSSRRAGRSTGPRLASTTTSARSSRLRRR